MARHHRTPPSTAARPCRTAKGAPVAAFAARRVVNLVAAELSRPDCRALTILIDALHTKPLAQAATWASGCHWPGRRGGFQPFAHRASSSSRNGAMYKAWITPPTSVPHSNGGQFSCRQGASFGYRLTTQALPELHRGRHLLSETLLRTGALPLAWLGAFQGVRALGHLHPTTWCVWRVCEPTSPAAEPFHLGPGHLYRAVFHACPDASVGVRRPKAQEGTRRGT